MSFKYIFIPSDTNEPIQEMEMAIPEGKDVECFLDRTKAHFSNAGGQMSGEQRQRQREQLIAQLGQETAASLDSRILSGALDIQMVENISLLPNSRETSYVGVNMYCDDQAQLKNLESNPRASSLAQSCGKMIDVKGDAFLARVFDNEDDFKRKDLIISEISSSAQWVKQALEISIRKQNDSSYQSQKDFLNRMGTHSSPPAPRVQVKELSPAEALKEEGNTAVKAGQWEQAVSLYTSSLSIDPSLTAALGNRSLALIKLGRFQEAIEDCTSVLSKEPKNIKSLIRRATARSALIPTIQGETDRQEMQALIIEDSEKVLEIEPNNKEAQKMKEAK